MNYFSDEKEWKWLFRNAVDWDTLLPLYYPTYPTKDGLQNKEEVLSFLEELLDSTGQWTGGAVTERATRLDEEGAGKIVDGKTVPGQALSELYAEASELQIIGLPYHQEHGGLEAPSIVHLLVYGQLARGCLASSTQMAFFTSLGEMLYRFCDDEDIDRIVPQIAAGKISGSMCMTEPGCGSDLGLIKTSATPKEDGSYLLNGAKIFITNGGGGIGFVLARVKGAPEGLKGLSLFLVEQEVDGKANYKITKNEDKLGMHGSFTCEVLYENSQAKLVGKENDGFKIMLYLMNEARIAVGMQALGLIEGSLKYAKDYALERSQFGKNLTELPLFKRNLNDYEIERDALRALMIDTLSYYDIFQKLDMKKRKTNDLSKEEKKLLSRASRVTRKRTPLVKYYACEAAVSLTQKAIQMLGGYGFIKEYNAERFHRDSFGPVLYEGTSQIQALMALKDTVKYAMSDPKGFLGEMASQHPASALMNLSHPWNRECKAIQYKTKKKMLTLFFKALKPQGAKALNPKEWLKAENVEGLMPHAETLTQALSYIETLEILSNHASIDRRRQDLFYNYKRLVLPRLEAIFCDWKERA